MRRDLSKCLVAAVWNKSYGTVSVMHTNILLFTYHKVQEVIVLTVQLHRTLERALHYISIHNTREQRVNRLRRFIDSQIGVICSP